MIDLSGVNLTLSVSEPEEFFLDNGEGPFPGTVIEVHGGLIAIRLDKTLIFNKTQFEFIVATVRYEEASFEDLVTKGHLIVNLVPIIGKHKDQKKSTSWIFDVVKQWRGVHLMGDLYRNF